MRVDRWSRVARSQDYLGHGLLLLRKIERLGILGPLGSELEDTRSWVYSKHFKLQMIRQRTGVEARGDNGYMDLSRSLLSGTKL